MSTYKLILNSLPILLPEPKPPRARAPRHRTHAHPLIDAPLRGGGALDIPSAFDEQDEDEDDEDVEAQVRARSRSRHARLSMSAQAHQVWVRKKTRRWYSVLAGALAGGLAILCEKRNRRTGIAQQMFVRCVQARASSCSDVGLIYARAQRSTGDVERVFRTARDTDSAWRRARIRTLVGAPKYTMLHHLIVYSCGQITYAFLLRPETLPRSYTNW